MGIEGTLEQKRVLTLQREINPEDVRAFHDFRSYFSTAVDEGGKPVFSCDGPIKSDAGAFVVHIYRGPEFAMALSIVGVRDGYLAVVRGGGKPVEENKTYTAKYAGNGVITVEGQTVESIARYASDQLKVKKW